MQSVRVQVTQSLDCQKSELPCAAARALGIDAAQVAGLQILRQSIDARRGQVRLSYTLAVQVKQGVRLRGNVQTVAPPQRPALVRGDRPMPHRPVVIGAGPCGLFCALALAQHGYRPIVLERGQDVRNRRQQVQAFFAGAPHQEENNVLFGDGGAGAFSDGKLTARGRDGFADLVLQGLMAHGAPREIGYLAKPHIGTDRLTDVIARLKQHIVQMGGSWHNGAHVVDLGVRDGRLYKVIYRCGGQVVHLPCTQAVLATGHSARDVYAMMQRLGAQLAFKPFAVGVRVEHPQAMIDRVQYGAYAGHPALGAAEYALTAQVGTRGVYTFCMCPGGMVVPSISQGGHLCVNGMSEHARDGENANAAVVVQVRQEDCGAEALSGVAFQQQWEKRAYDYARDYVAPAQRLDDFLAHRKTVGFGDVRPSYPRGVAGAELNALLPAFVAQGLAGAFAQFGRKLRGFDRPDAVLTGVEMRTSAPVRILRGEDRQAPGIGGLYPAGEGAGYAGGIVSAGADGIRTAFQIMTAFAPALTEQSDI